MKHKSISAVALFIFTLLIKSCFAGTGDPQFDFTYRVTRSMGEFQPNDFFERNKRLSLPTILAHINYTNDDWKDDANPQAVGTCKIVKQFVGPITPNPLNLRYRIEMRNPWMNDRYMIYDPNRLVNNFGFLGSIDLVTDGVLNKAPKIEVLLTPYWEKVFELGDWDRACELNKECGIDFHQVKITYDHITEAEVPGAIKRLTGDPLVAFFQIQLFFEEKLITKYETFVAVLSLFESRDFKRELEYFAERGNVKDIRDSLFKKWLSELDNQDIDHGRLNDLRVLIETPSQLNSIDSKAIYDKLVSRYSACHIRFCTGMN